VRVCTGYKVANTPNVVSCIQINKIFACKGVVTLPKALPGFVLTEVHKVHILDPTLIS
jgi:hypothetical protein